MVCEDDAVRALINHQKVIDEDGISEEDILPISVLDIAAVDLQATAEYLTAGAYQKLYLLGQCNS